MDKLNPAVLCCARASIVALWCATAIISFADFHGRGAALLHEAGIPASWHGALIVGGALLDGAVGLAMWRWHKPVIYKLAAANLLIMTVAATLLLPALWLDPLGSLTKNLPIAALLWVLHRDAQQ